MIERLHRVAVAARDFLEPVWLEWHRAWAPGVPDPAIPSTHTCGRTSLFLQEILGLEGLHAEWASGVPRLAEMGPEIGPYGFFAGGRWEGHAWVECAGWIVDITADQFGADPVIVTPTTDSRYKRGTGDTALPEFARRRREAVDAILTGWTALRHAGNIQL
ncbi:hypothetical protein [Hyphomicrobium sp. 2TAF46]|uniref:hypothetical protein n=1 Tax=Hyphomicrobium sp. 2TAF46 TaxID=3233019 RepID=UPI003F9245D7